MSDLYLVDSDALPPETRVAAWRGRQRLSATYEYELWLLVPEHAAVELDPDAVLLAVGTFVIAHEDGAHRTQVHGVWSALELLRESPGGASLYRAVLVPTVWKLGLSRHSRVFVDKSIPDILTATLRAGGLTSAQFELRLSGSYKPRPHVCQYRESDLAFVARWAEREGLYWFFEQGDDGDKLVFVDARSAHAEAPNGPVHLVTEDAGGTGGTEGFGTFTQREVYRIKEYKLRDYDPHKPTSPVEGQGAVVSSAEGVRNRHLVDNFVDSSAGRRLAQVRAEEQLAGRSRFRGEGRVFDVVPGLTFTLDGHPRAAFNQEYLAVELEHHGHTLETNEELSPWIPFRDGREYAAAITAIPETVQYRAPLVTPAPRVAGVEMATVDGPIESEYAQLDEAGSYLVRLHFDENANADGKASTRVRMLQPHAGAPEGFHFPLRKGTEVMVVFLGGDPDRPLIAAAVPNAATVSPVVQANHTQNVLHTGGDNRLEIEDSADDQYIDLYSPPKNTFIHLGKPHARGDFTRAPHTHEYVTSTDGNGLIHTGGDLNVTVGGKKNEHICKSVLEEYDKTQSTDVTGPVTEKYHVDLHTTVDLHCQETYETTQTTNVSTHTKEVCKNQETHVRGALTEHHVSQDTTVATNWDVTCDSEIFDTGASTQTDGTLTWNIHRGSLIKCATFTMSGPQYDMRATSVIRVEGTRQHVNVNKIDTGPLKIDVVPTIALKMAGLATNQITFKGDVLKSGLEVWGAKIEGSGVKIGAGSSSIELVGFRFEPGAIKLFLLGFLTYL
jgi:type VI secretion system secreted protein VgrG